ncbi:MAG: helix-turn-helix transcriptional regulator [Candidatus Sungbacteria bacterium]|uniref:Helix-turn-helix transcriptional regulator n=1 Tax=Candidatus Sungiibacteriota bacterium TaxID=2750080 RepID=A0A931YDB7_9BACT|nr:helix-turn-helix transcriptional regulator [Candidatus Sungbacteria bacterium]MBI2465801.1 helix-turn-helix transcriptional regulator [Candidatus Sungbacteria bacterium]
MPSFANSIKKLRQKLGLSQDDFACKADVAYTTLTKIETGVIKKPSVFVVNKIAKALSVDIEELLK